MIPSKTWFPSSLAERLLWFANFAAQFANYAAILGLAADVTAVNEDNDDFQSIGKTTVTAENFKKAIIDFRISLTEGNTGDPAPVFPSENFTQPPNKRPAGIFERLDNLRSRILLSATYTAEIGAALGIIPGEKAEAPEETLKPVIKASALSAPYKLKVDVTRLGMPGYRVEFQRAGSSVWELGAFATSNPCEFAITPTTPGEPERILVRAILLKNNEQVGEPSDPTYVTVNP